MIVLLVPVKKEGWMMKEDKKTLQAIEALERKRLHELQLYIDTPMIHPLYREKRKHFKKKYKKDFPEKNNKDHAKKLWKMFWLNVVKEFLRSEYHCRFKVLMKRLENITKKRFPKHDVKEELSEGSSSSSDDCDEDSSSSVSNIVKVKEKAPRGSSLQEVPSQLKDTLDGKEYIKIITQIVQEPNLRQLQAKDETLKILFHNSENGMREKKKMLESSFIIKEGLLHRAVFNTNSNEFTTQLVVPTDYRQFVINFSHCGLLSGHAGKAVTIHRIMKEFYWNNIYNDVKSWAESCSACQRTTPKGSNLVDVYLPQPVIGEPFIRCALDIVGPFNPSLQGFKYILVLTDLATNWPEAIPLKSISPVVIASSLGDIFARLGVPIEILSDQRMPLTPHMDEIFRLMRMKGLKVVPDYCICNGTSEWLNSSLIKILKSLCFEQPKYWHEFLKPLLFAYREVEHKNTGFSPFCLLYGEDFSGSMQILRAFLEGSLPEDKDDCIAYQHVLDLKKRLSHTCAIAMQECNKVGNSVIDQQQNQGVLRSLKVRDEVLLLSHVSSDKLSAEWHGPYKIKMVKKVLYYIVDVDGHEKECHINMLKTIR